MLWDGMIGGFGASGEGWLSPIADPDVNRRSGIEQVAERIICGMSNLERGFAGDQWHAR